MKRPRLFRKSKGSDAVDHYDIIDRCRVCRKRGDADAGLRHPSCSCMVISIGVRPLRDFVDLDDDVLWEMRSVRDGREPWRGRR